jgi:hypothetical protein
MKISANIIETNAEITKQILDRLAIHVNAAIYRMQRPLTARIQPWLREALYAQPHYASLLAGRLRGDLGLTDVQFKLEEIIDRWVTAVSVELTQVKNTGRSLKGGMEISMVMSGFVDVLQMSAAEQETEKHQFLPWLQWLLKEGDKTIILGYGVQYGGLGVKLYSRTKLAIMRKGKARNWNVPSEFAGTLQKNWVTLAIESISENVLLAAVQNEFEANMR